MINNIDFLNKILNDIWNLHLVLLQVSLTLFTVLYSFIVSKRDDLKTISEQIKLGDNNPMLAQRASFTKKYILRFKGINYQITFLIVMTFLLFMFGWISERLINDNSYEVKKICLYILGFVTLILLLYSILMFYKLHNDYRKATKI